jgi:hypothetical protein
MNPVRDSCGWETGGQSPCCTAVRYASWDPIAHMHIPAAHTRRLIIRVQDRRCEWNKIATIMLLCYFVVLFNLFSGMLPEDTGKLHDSFGSPKHRMHYKNDRSRLARSKSEEVFYILYKVFWAIELERTTFWGRNFLDYWCGILQENEKFCSNTINLGNIGWHLCKAACKWESKISKFLVVGKWFPIKNNVCVARE